MFTTDRILAHLLVLGAGNHGAIPSGLLRVPAVVLSVLVLAGGCAPLRHTIRPYDSEPFQAHILEEQATALCAATRPGGTLPPHTFTTDGCSVWPDGEWVECCVEHDMRYWCGGTRRARHAADQRLGECFAGLGHSVMADWIYLGVRVGGWPALPFSWRWGYGWPWPRGYDGELESALSTELHEGTSGAIDPGTR
jgi:hypothetical protein